MDEIPFKCQDIGERGFIRYTLDCTKGRIVQCFEAIPDTALYCQPHQGLNSAAWIFGHIATTERAHLGGFAQGIWDIPKRYGILDSCASIPTEQELMDSIGSKASIISYWDSVREQTHEYLDALSDEEMKSLPGHMGEPFNNSPVREFFAMTIHHQNYHFGQLYQIAQMNGIDPN
jgi:uncharacterized damage-inducible protein DinB